MEFAFKELKVWQRSVEFADRILGLIENLLTGKKHFRIIEQVESSVVSICNNIAEGKGRFSKKEYIHFLYIARGSVYETVTLLNLLARRGWISKGELNQLERDAMEITLMIKGLINSIFKSIVKPLIIALIVGLAFLYAFI